MKFEKINKFTFDDPALKKKWMKGVINTSTW